MCLRFLSKQEDFLFLESFDIDNIQQIADAVHCAKRSITNCPCEPPQARARLNRLRNELCIDSFHGVLARNCGRAKCQCCTATGTVVAYRYIAMYNCYL